jgi:pyruvate,water dikinase
MASTDLIGWFADIGLTDRPTVGGKGGSLGELTRAAIAVPAGFVVRTTSFERMVGELEKQAPVAVVVEALSPDDLDGITRVSRELRQRVESAALPQDVCEAILHAHAQLCDSAAGGDRSRRSPCGPRRLRRTPGTPVCRPAGYLPG